MTTFLRLKDTTPTDAEQYVLKKQKPIHEELQRAKTYLNSARAAHRLSEEALAEAEGRWQDARTMHVCSEELTALHFPKCDHHPHRRATHGYGFDMLCEECAEAFEEAEEEILRARVEAKAEEEERARAASEARSNHARSLHEIQGQPEHAHHDELDNVTRPGCES